MKNVFKKAETEEQLTVRWADSLILNSDAKGVVSKKSLRIDAYNSDIPPTEQEKTDWDKNTSRIIRDKALKKSLGAETNYGVIIHDLNRYSTAVKKFLFDNDYINEPNNHENFLILTPTGKEVKKHKGHNKYKNYIDKKLRAEKAEINGKIHWLRRVIITAIVSGLIGYGLRYLIEPKEKKSTDQTLMERKSQKIPAKPSEKTDSTINK
jgi:hypothetical protein